VLLAASTVVALGLRLTGIGCLLPALVEPEGGALPLELERLERGERDAKSESAAPTLIAQCARLAPAKVVGTSAGPPTLDAALAASVDANLRVRKTVACLSALTVPLTYLVARAFLSSGWSLLAAAFLATSFLQQWFAQEARTDAAATTFFVLALLGALGVRRYGTPVVHLLAGVALGLAVGAHEAGVLLVFPLIVAACASSGSARSRWWLVGSLAAAALAAWPCRSATFFEFDGDARSLRFAGGTFGAESFDFDGAKLVALALWSHEPMLALLGGVALATLLLRMLQRPGAPGIENGRDAAVVFAYVGPLLLAACLATRGQARALIPLLPPLAIVAAWALSFWSERARARRHGARLAALLVLAPLAVNGVFAANLARVRAAPDTIARAVEWFRDPKHFDRARERIAVLPPVDLPLAWSDRSLAAVGRDVPTGGFPWLDFQRGADPARKPTERFHVEWLALATPERRDAAAADPERFVRELDVDYVVVHALRMVHRHPAFTAVRNGLLARAQLIERFSPDGGRVGEIPLDFEDPAPDERTSRAWRVLFADSTGPVMEIYRLRRGGDER
jgi:hypothetical protein